MSRSELTAKRKGGHINVSQHAADRLLSRTAVSTRRQIEDLQFYDVRRYNDDFPLDGDLVFCSEANALGAREGLTLVTVVGYTERLELVDGKFQKPHH